MTTIKNFLSDSIIVGFAQIATRAGALISLPILTKVYGPELYGLWVQIILIVSLLTVTALLRLETACVRYLSSIRDKTNLAKNYYAILLISLASTTLFSILGIIFSKSISQLLLANIVYRNYIIGAMLWILTKSLFIIVNVYFRSTHRTKRFALNNFINSWSEVGIIYAGAVSSFVLDKILLLCVIKDLILATLIILMVVKELGLIVPDFGCVKTYLLYSIPLIPNSGLLWVVNASDRFLINHYVGLSASGIYSAYYSISSIIMLLYTPLTVSFFPILSRYWDEENGATANRLFNYCLKIFIFLAIPSIIGIYLVSERLLKVLTTNYFIVSSHLMLVLCLGIFVLGIYQINVYIVHMIKKTKYLISLFLIAALLNIFLNIILIPAYGLLGAALATLCSYSVLACIIFVWSYKYIFLEVNLRFIIKCLVSSFIMAIVVVNINGEQLLGLMVSLSLGFTIYVISFIMLKGFTNREKEFLLTICRNLLR